jgi:hypothetical protein
LGVSAPGLDSLHVLEQIMAHFYLRGMALKSKGGKAELIDASLLQAAAIAKKVLSASIRSASVRLIRHRVRKCGCGARTTCRSITGVRSHQRQPCDSATKCSAATGGSDFADFGQKVPSMRVDLMLPAAEK